MKSEAVRGAWLCAMRDSVVFGARRTEFPKPVSDGCFRGGKVVVGGVFLVASPLRATCPDGKGSAEGRLGLTVAVSNLAVSFEACTVAV